MVLVVVVEDVHTEICHCLHTLFARLIDLGSERQTHAFAQGRRGHEIACGRCSQPLLVAAAPHAPSSIYATRYAHAEERPFGDPKTKLCVAVVRSTNVTNLTTALCLAYFS